MMNLSAPSGEVVKSVPEIIKQASSSTLGIFALMILLVGGLAYAFFKSAPVKTRARIFMSMFFGVVLYGIAITRAATSPGPTPIPAATSQVAIPADAKAGTVSVDGVVIDAANNSGISGGQIFAIGNTVPAISDSNGAFHLEVRSADSASPIDLRVNKDGYDALDWKLRLPIPNGVTIPLQRSTKH